MDLHRKARADRTCVHLIDASGFAILISRRDLALTCSSSRRLRPSFDYNDPDSRTRPPASSTAALER